MLILARFYGFIFLFPELHHHWNCCRFIAPILWISSILDDAIVIRSCGKTWVPCSYDKAFYLNWYFSVYICIFLLFWALLIHWLFFLVHLCICGLPWCLNLLGIYFVFFLFSVLLDSWNIFLIN